jgi:hypothetical protein
MQRVALLEFEPFRVAGHLRAAVITIMMVQGFTSLGSRADQLGEKPGHTLLATIARNF